MEFKSKFFSELSTKELYEILKARESVFIVEQKCPYHDIDGEDIRSLHVFYERDGAVAAYLRAYKKDSATVQMGRVLTIERGTGLGGKLLKAGLAEISEKLRPERIYIEAQCYATGFYEREGFKICSDEFDEDGIAHVGMELIIR